MTRRRLKARKLRASFRPRAIVRLGRSLRAMGQHFAAIADAVAENIVGSFQAVADAVRRPPRRTDLVLAGPS